MSAEPPLSLIARGLAAHLGMPVDDPDLQAAATGCLIASPRLLQVISSGWGAVKIHVENHHIAHPAVTVEQTDGLPVEFRGRNT